MNIAVIGAGGKAGRLIAEEACSRGWDVSSLVRSPENHPDLVGTARVCDASSRESVASAINGVDVVVLAIGPVPGEVDSLALSTSEVLAGLTKADVTRLVMVGGAGTLLTDSDDRIMDTQAFPAAALPTARAHERALDKLKQDGSAIDWVYVSPALKFLPDAERRGEYLLGQDNLLLGMEGLSQVSYADFAVAVIDEVESNSHHRQRITVAWK